MAPQHITVTFPGGEGFTNQITNWTEPDGPGSVQITTTDGETLIIGGYVGWFIDGSEVPE